MARKPKVAYTITDAGFPPFNVRWSANAWWMDQRKVENLIAGFKTLLGVSGSCTYAGITTDQYSYFLQKHPEFRHVRSACEQMLLIKATNVLVGDIANPTTAKFLLKNRSPKFNHRLVDPDASFEEPEPPRKRLDRNYLERLLQSVSEKFFTELRSHQSGTPDELLHKDGLDDAQENEESADHRHNLNGLES